MRPGARKSVAGCVTDICSFPILVKFSLNLCFSYPLCKRLFTSLLGFEAILIVKNSYKSLDGEHFMKYGIEIITMTSKKGENVGRQTFCSCRLDPCQVKGSIQGFHLIQMHNYMATAKAMKLGCGVGSPEGCAAIWRNLSRRKRHGEVAAIL